MRGFSEMVTACWRIQNKYTLSDKEMFKLLSSVSIKYNEKLERLMNRTAEENKINKRKENDIIAVDQIDSRSTDDFIRSRSY